MNFYLALSTKILKIHAMDAIRLVCPECDAVHRVKSVTLGKLYRCKKCKSGLITMQPAVLVCPVCGATHPPAHIEVSRLATCDECETMPTLNARIAGMTFGSVSSESAVSEETATTSDNNHDNFPESKKKASEEIEIAHRIPTRKIDLPPPAPPVNDVVIETTINPLPPLKEIIAPATDIAHQEFQDNESTTADRAESFFFSNEDTQQRDTNNELTEIEASEASDLIPQTALHAFTSETTKSASNFANELTELKALFRAQRLPIFSRPIFGWVCLAILILLFGYSLAVNSAREREVREMRRQLNSFEQRANDDYEGMKNLLTRRIDDLEKERASLRIEKTALENDLRDYYNKLNETQRKVNLLNRAYSLGIERGGDQ